MKHMACKYQMIYTAGSAFYLKTWLFFTMFKALVKRTGK